MSDGKQLLAGLTAEQKELLLVRLARLNKPGNQAAQNSRMVAKPVRPKNLPLSFAQHRLWFLDQLQPGNPAYNISLALRLEGSLDEQALHRSIHETVRRHEALRTSFAARDGEPYQFIHELDGIEMPLVDLLSWPEQERQEKARALANEEAHTPFDLGRAPLLRVTLLRLAEQEHLLLITMHHIVSDGWSVPIIAHEITESYRAYRMGQRPSLPDLPFQYADFTLWQREQMEAGAMEQHLNYWRGQLAEFNALELPADHPRPKVMTNRAGSARFEISSELTGRVKELGRREGATLFMVLMTAFQIVLGWYARRGDVSVGTDIAGRVNAETERLIGFFVNQLLIRTHLAEDRSFAELLRQVRSTALDAYNHQDLPFDKLVGAVMPERVSNRSPLIEVKLVVLNMPQGQSVETSGLRVSLERVAPVKAKFDLLLTVWEYESRLRAAIEYRSELFEAATIEMLRAGFEEVLAVAGEQPEIRLSELRATLEQSRHRAVRKALSARPGSIRRKEILITS